MVRSFRRAAMLAAASVVVLGAQAASATTFVFLGDNATQAFAPAAKGQLPATGGLAIPSLTTDGLSLNAYGLHLATTGRGSVASTDATAETYKGYGLGVRFGADKGGDGTHQIDNAGVGVDYVALVFNQAVTLGNFALKAWGGSAVGSGTDAQFAAYAGTLDALRNGKLDTGIFQAPTATTTTSKGLNFSYTLDSTGSSAVSKIWLVAANVNDTNDAFKLLYLDAKAAGSPGGVPEPATWAMMLMGFGAVGAGLRRRRGTATAIA